MTPEFIFRLIGMVVFAILGARLGAQTAEFLNLDIESRAFIFGLVGVLFGLIVTPWLTVRPIRFLRRSLNEVPIERLLMTMLGIMVGAVVALFTAYPLSLLPEPFGVWLPVAILLLAIYLNTTIFGVRNREILDMLALRLGKAMPRAAFSNRKLLLDTSVLIDGRIVEVAETGFIGGTLMVPHFVLNELHRVADSSDPLRRKRGRRGLDLLNKLQRNDITPVTIIDDDVEDITDVDHKLVALALQMGAAVVTGDYNLKQVAEAQSVTVLNINSLANAVRPMFIPGERFVVRIIQEGRDANQGIGYLDDGTMVVVENGKTYMDRSIPVEVTKLISKETGRMIFAIPEGETYRAPNPIA
jgi:uncharacterized protein YacL